MATTAASCSPTRPPAPRRSGAGGTCWISNAPTLGLEQPRNELQQMLPVVVPLGLEIARDLIPLVEPDAQGASRALDELAPQVRDALERQYGFMFPGIRIRGNTSDLPDGTALVLIDEVPESLLRIDPQQVVVNATPERLAALGVAAQELGDAAWGRIACVPGADRAAVQGLRLNTMDATEYLFHALFEVVQRMPHEFLRLDAVHRLVSALPSDLVQRTVPAVVSWIPDPGAAGNTAADACPGQHH